MLSMLQCTFCLNQNNVNDDIKPRTRRNLKCVHVIMLCPGITLTLAMPLISGKTFTQLCSCVTVHVLKFLKAFGI